MSFYWILLRNVQNTYSTSSELLKIYWLFSLVRQTIIPFLLHQPGPSYNEFVLFCDKLRSYSLLKYEVKTVKFWIINEVELYLPSGNLNHIKLKKTKAITMRNETNEYWMIGLKIFKLFFRLDYHGYGIVIPLIIDIETIL